MGLLKHLLFWPVTGPTFLAEFSLRKVEGVVRQELTDDQAIKEELLALQIELELGDIDDDEYLRREAALMERLREVRRWREEFGLGTSGGPVRVAQSGARSDRESSEKNATGGIAEPGGATVELSLDWEE